MTTLVRIDGMFFQASDLVPEGMHLLWKNGRPVYCGRIGEPIEDADCDEIWLHPSDYERLQNRIEAQ